MLTRVIFELSKTPKRASSRHDMRVSVAHIKGKRSIRACQIACDIR